MKKEEGINVLSTFNGMGCIWIALDRLGIKVNKRYSSEIDKYANIVNNANYPDTIQLGDVRNINVYDLENIDLFVGGSPCQGFSFAGKQLNFNDPRSALFFEFLRLWEDIKEINPDAKFLLENVRMKKHYQDVITNYLGVEPIEINSALVSAQNRKRLYWTNLEQFDNPDDLCVTNKDIIDYSNQEPNKKGWQYWWNKNKDFQLSKKYSSILNDNDKAITQTARQMASWNGNLVRTHSGLLRFASPFECERLQTVPDNYTNYVSNSQRYKMLGNGWTVDVIAHILKGLNINEMNIKQAS